MTELSPADQLVLGQRERLGLARQHQRVPASSTSSSCTRPLAAGPAQAHDAHADERQQHMSPSVQPSILPAVGSVTVTRRSCSSSSAPLSSAP